MVLGQPQRVVAAAVHLLRDRFELVVDAGERRVVEAPLVGRRRILPVIGKIDVPGIDRHEFVDHRNSFLCQSAACRQTPRTAWPSRWNLPLFQSKVSTVRATSPAFIARNASLMSPSLPVFVTMPSRSSRPCL